MTFYKITALQPPTSSRHQPHPSSSSCSTSAVSVVVAAGRLRLACSPLRLPCLAAVEASGGLPPVPPVTDGTSLRTQHLGAHDRVSVAASAAHTRCAAPGSPSCSTSSSACLRTVPCPAASLSGSTPSSYLPAANQPPPSLSPIFPTKNKPPRPPQNTTSSYVLKTTHTRPMPLPLPLSANTTQ